jgi:hypothetical protein
MSDPTQPPQVSPDGNFYWDGAKWVPMQQGPAEASTPSTETATPAATTNLIARKGRWLSPDQKLWWNGAHWLPYRPITWNSIHIHTNPPEDRSTLSRNLGIWCALFGILGVFGLGIGALSIMAAVAGPVSIYNGLSFLHRDGQNGVRLPGAGKAWAGVILSLVGMSGFLIAIVGLLARIAASPA